MVTDLAATARLCDAARQAVVGDPGRAGRDGPGRDLIGRAMRSPWPPAGTIARPAMRTKPPGRGGRSWRRRGGPAAVA
ncbi:MAG TPA: hypothetical protein VKP69_34545 [Isosphaeraceae bacterium]|nr:hypothetical protein [Isosphaeraceae bacterium]